MNISQEWVLYVNGLVERPTIHGFNGIQHLWWNPAVDQINAAFAAHQIKGIV